MAIRLFLLAMICVAPVLHAESFEESRLEKEVLVTDCEDAVQVEAAKNGDVWFIERSGNLRVYSPATRSTRIAGVVPAIVQGEGGLTGFALAPDFAETGWIYFYYSPSEEPTVMRISRFTVANGTLDLKSEKILRSFTYQVGSHRGGGMQIDAKGDLWLSTGDNSTALNVPQTDCRPDRLNFNALRSAANSMDLRGKILRIHPQPDGSATNPAGNLFTDAKQGRPEIFAMGCRNPYRLFVDSPTGTVYWGEVGPNNDEKYGTGGYDEINRTSTPGNFGWPLFVGPNVPYTRFDPVSGKPGEKYDVNKPVNEWPDNPGLKQLPPIRPPFIWYGSEDSKEFPELGNGGRNALAGPFYRFDPALKSDVKLPEIFDGRLFIYDWCRNWIKTVGVTADGKPGDIRPFRGDALLRRPIDLKLGPDGALYLLEFGERWAGNKDGLISRIVYRRGNRPPKAVASADVLAGSAPLVVKFSAKGSLDPDGDVLKYDWNCGEGTASGEDTTWTYQKNGVRKVQLTVTDSKGAINTATLNIAIGNSPPEVKITTPANGSFFEWGQEIPYAVTVTDAEDGRVPSDKIRLNWAYREQAAGNAAVPEIGFEGGAGLIRKSTCLSCHQLATASVGPSYLEVAARYQGDPAAEERLAKKIHEGGYGSWGEVPMPAHPQHTLDDLKLMVDYILGVKPPDSGKKLKGATGIVKAKDGESHAAGGTHVLTATYTDGGAAGVPPLTREAVAILHARITRAASFDEAKSATVMEVSTLKRQRRICVQLGAGSHLLFKQVNLAGISKVKCEIAASKDNGGILELRAGSPEGQLVGKVQIPETGQWDNWAFVTVPITDPGGAQDLYVVGGAGTKRFNLNQLEFIP